MINKSMKIIQKDRIRTTTRVLMINYLKEGLMYDPSLSADAAS